MSSWSSKLSNFFSTRTSNHFHDHPRLRTISKSHDSVAGLVDCDMVLTTAEHHEGTLAVLNRKAIFRQRLPSKTSIWSVDPDPTTKAQFFQAIGLGNIAEADRLIQLTPDLIGAKTSSGQSVLHIAAQNGNIALIDFLIEKHADLNARDENGNTPMHIAVMNGDDKALAALLVFKADPNLKNNALNAPVHLAVREGKVAVLQTLIDHSSTDINAPGQNGETALHVAAAANNVPCLDILVRHRASVSRSCYNGLRPIHVAASRGSVDILKYLFTDGNLGYSKSDLLAVTDDELGTPLHAAVYGGNKTVVEILLQNGASVTAQTRDLVTPLHLACSLGLTDIVRLICEDCPSDEVDEVIDMKDDQGMTPLHRAVMFSHWRLIMLLMNKGAKLDETDYDGRTPLVLAASRSATESVSELLMLGADTSIRDNEGRNFLHYVVITGGDQEAFHADLGDDDMFCRLLNEKDKHGSTPLHYAAQSGFGNCSEALLRLGASLTSKNTQARSPLHYAAEFGRYNTVKKLLQTAQGIGVINDIDREGCTALHLAARNGHAKVVHLLLTNGALIHKYIAGGTSLHAAVMHDHIETAELLIEHYTYLIDIADKLGNTALHVATKHNAPNCTELLLTKSASLSANKDNYTAMDLAIANHSQEAALAMIGHNRWREIVLQESAIYGRHTIGLIHELPLVMKAVLDRSISPASCHPLARDYYEKYDYSILQLDEQTDDPGSRVTMKAQVAQKSSKKLPLEALNEMVKFKRYNLVAHPVCKSYLNSKWMSYGIYFHFSNLLIYSIFLGLLTFLVLRGVEIDLKPHITDQSLDNLFANKPNTSRHNISYFGPLTINPDITAESLPNVDIVFLYFILLFTTSHLLKKLLQICIQGSRYFFRLTNYFELVCYTSTLAFAVSFLDVRDRYVPWKVQWALGSVAIFCAWFNLILHMQRYGKPGIYVGIFFREMRILMKSASVYFVMIVAFSMAFCVLNPEKIFPDTESFYQQDHGDDSPNDWQTAHKTLQSSLLRISDMLVGDVDAIQNYIDPLLNDQLIFPGATYFLALVTVGVVTLLIQAILMGTAVYDLEKVEKSATINILAMQVSLHTDLESNLPASFVKRFQKAEAVIFPNRTKWRLLTKWFNIFTTGDLEGLSGKHHRREESRTKVSEPSESVPSNLSIGQKRIKECARLKDVAVKMDHQYELLRMVVQRMNIKVDRDVVDDPTVASRRISRYAVRQSPRPRTNWKSSSAGQSTPPMKSAMKGGKSGRKSASFGILDSDSSSVDSDIITFDDIHTSVIRNNPTITITEHE